MKAEQLTETMVQATIATLAAEVVNPVVAPASNLVPMTWDDDGLFFQAFKYKRVFRFVKMNSPTMMTVWEQHKEGDWHKERLGSIDVHHVGVDALKKIGVWDALNADVQKEITEGLVQKSVEEVAAKGELVERLAKARAGRKSKYANIPKELTCTECHNTVEVVPSQIAAKCEAKGLLLVDFIADFHCKRCRPPKKGKQGSGIPNVVLACKCGFTVSYPMSVIQKTLDKKGLALNDYVAGYQCQKCNPTKGRGKKK